MKKLASIGLAVATVFGTMATTVPAATAQSAGFDRSMVQTVQADPRLFPRNSHRHWRSDRRWNNHRYYDRRYDRRYYRGGRYYRHRDFNPGAAIIGGAVGLAIGSAIANRGGNWNAHANWCANRYRTYDPRSDTYVPRVGVRARCNSPYN